MIQDYQAKNTGRTIQLVQEMKSKHKHKTGNRTKNTQNKSIHPKFHLTFYCKFQTKWKGILSPADPAGGGLASVACTRSCDPGHRWTPPAQVSSCVLLFSAAWKQRGRAAESTGRLCGYLLIWIFKWLGGAVINVPVPSLDLGTRHTVQNRDINDSPPPCNQQTHDMEKQ